MIIILEEKRKQEDGEEVETRGLDVKYTYIYTIYGELRYP